MRKDSVTMLSPTISAGGEELFGAEKLQEVERLMNLLDIDLEKKNLFPPQRNATLDQLKVHTRSSKDAGSLFTDKGVSVLCRHSFEGNSPKTARAALKCLANVMLLEASTRQMFVDLGFAPKAAEKLKSDDREDEFLASRLLFLCTYDTNLNFDELFENNALAEGIVINLTRHAKSFAKVGSKGNAPIPDVLALSETLKLIFNLTQFYPERISSFTKGILPILQVAANLKIPTPPLQPPVTYIVNALINLDLEDKKGRHFATSNPIFPKFDAHTNSDRFIRILRTAVRQYKDEQLEQLACPLLTLIRKIYEIAPEIVKIRMRELLLPSEADRDLPIARADSLSGYLLRLSTSAVAPNLRESISNLMFELSGRDATSFVKNVGYGFAAGFLMTHDMPIPENAMEAFSTNPDGSATNVGGHEVNPITGQRRDKEIADDGPEMTQEEKEREAERLFVLFER
jgi:hypothetical protein